MKINLDAYMTIDFWRYINPLYGSMCICDADSSLWLYLHAVTSAVQRIPETAYTVRCGVTIVQVLFKVIEIGTNRKPICDFLLVFHCNYMPIFYRFRYTTVYWQNFFLLFLLTVVSLEALALDVPLVSMI